MDIIRSCPKGMSKMNDFKYSTTTTAEPGYWLKCIFANGFYGDFKRYLKEKCVKSCNRTAYNFLVSINKAKLFKVVRCWYDGTSSLHNIVKTEWL